MAQAFGAVFVAVKYCGAAYLLFLAWRLWSAPAVIGSGAGEGPDARGQIKLFLAGLAVTLGNPKVIVFYLALLPSLIDLGRVSIAGWAVLSAVTLGVLAMVFGGYVLMAARARRLLTSPSRVRLINRTSAGIMAGAAAAIAAR